MASSIKKRVVTTIAISILAFQLLLLSHPFISCVYSCVTQNPKLLYYAICWHLENDSDKSFCGKINSVVAGIKGYATLHPLHPLYLGVTKDDVKLYWIDIWGYVQKKLGIIYYHGIDENMVYLKNGHLIFLASSSSCIDKTPSDISAEEYGKIFNTISQYFKKKNVDVLYLAFPQHLHQKTVLPYGLKDDLNQISSDRIKKIKENDITAIDARELFKDSPDVHYQLFYKGDHHWVPEYAYRVYFYIFHELEKQHSPMTKYFDCTNMAWNDYYIEKRLPPFHEYLGSGVRRVGRLYLPQRDITPYMIPRKETNFTFQVPSLDINKTGSVNDTFLDFYRDEPAEIIINHRVGNKNKIMIFHDSFIHSFAPFLATNNHCLYMIDMRHFQGNIIDLIEQEKPDAIIFAYSRWTPFSHLQIIEQQIQEKQKIDNTSKND